ncbi:hypothetical protein [Curtobacterium sp. MCLR17_034]|uniref:hypothetical protein n=1 Tax=Curtobacterium sp. MCLR17_034 TaxID=2175623 RepID=UPI0011B6D447|nr:hypothetical protein [Curtobacterium sp. MCLR17_034]
MTDPVNTDALRKAGERADYYQTGDGPLWRATADDVDRLRLSEQDASSVRYRYESGVTVGGALVQATETVDKLRSLIENAPHDRDESCGFGVAPRDMSNCTCWKSTAR